MSKSGSGLLGTEKRGAKPPHPDRERWFVAFFGFGVVVIGLWGAPAALWRASHNAYWDRYVRTHLLPLSSIRSGFWYGALFFLGVSVLGLLWTGFVWIRWRWRLRRIHGQYLTLVIPKPQNTRDSATNTNPEAPYVLWDRLIAMLQTAKQGSMPPYLAAELWGDSGGRVQWGLWLPNHVRNQREAMRRLMTAERPQSRLVDAPDPLMTALVRNIENKEDTGERWYASALLILHARDYYPLLQDGLSQASLVAALRPPRVVHASGVSVIITPAPFEWARRIDLLVQRWRWISRYQRRFDERWKQETDEISLKAQQAHARVCLRLHVVAATRADAQAECRNLITTVTSSRKRYTWASQYWQARDMRIHRVYGAQLPPAGRARAPFRPLPRLLPLFPFI